MKTRYVTELTTDVIAAITATGQSFIQTSGASEPFDVQWFIAVWKSAMEQKFAALWALEDGDKIVGLFGAVLSPCLFTGVTVATESFWFVEPEYRKGMGGIRLYQEFAKWAELVGVRRIQMAHLAGLSEAELEKFYVGRGFTKQETIYKKSL